MKKIIITKKNDAEQKSNPNENIIHRKILKLIKIKRRKCKNKKREKCLANKVKINKGMQGYILNFIKYNRNINTSLMNNINDKIKEKKNFIINNNSNLEKSNIKIKKDESCQTDLNDLNLINQKSYINQNNNIIQQNRNVYENNNNSNLREIILDNHFNPLISSFFYSNSLINHQHQYVNNFSFCLKHNSNNITLGLSPFIPSINNNNENNNDGNNSNNNSINNNMNTYMQYNNTERIGNNIYTGNNIRLNNNNDNKNIKSIKEKLSKIKIEKQYLINNNNQKNCIICLEDFKYSQTIYKLPCFHTFHIHCFNKEVKFRQKCPACRRNL